MKYEITKMLTLSTSHITKETADKLDIKVIYAMNYIPLPIYNKDGYGWFICLSSYLEMLDEIELPEDLIACCSLAVENDCEWLCLDCDGLIMSELKTYDWD